jgi:hypothetical protein
MKTKQLFLLFALFLVACGPTTTQPATAIPTDDHTHENEESDTAGEVNLALANEATNIADEENIVPATLTSDYFASYQIDDTGYGTEVTVTIDLDANTRTIAANALPNHETGDFPNSGNPNTITEQNKTWVFPYTPTYTGNPTDVRETGVAINGVKFEPGTAEVATCTNGVQYRIEGIQDLLDLGLDFNNAHVQPNGEYHYHGVADMLVEAFDTSQDLVHVAFAADGHNIYYSKSGAYTSGYQIGEDARAGTNCTYTGGGRNAATVTFGAQKDGSVVSDWEWNANTGELDQCNGITIDGEYVYLITDDYPYIPRCLMGEFTEATRGPGGPGGGPPP